MKELIVEHFKTPSHGRGITFLFLTMICFSFVDTCSKEIALYVEPVFTNLFRYIALVIVTFFLLKKKGSTPCLKVKSKIQLVLRGLFQGATGLFYLLALQILPLNIAVSIYFAAPLLTIILSSVILKESITKKQVLSAFIGFAGVIIILRPSMNIDLTGASLMICAMMCFSLLHIYTRKLSGEANSWEQVFYGNLGALSLALSALVFAESLPTNISFDYLILFALLIFFTTGGQIFLVKAFSDAPVSVLTPFNYFQLVFVIFLAYIFFGENLDIISLLGVSIIIGAGIYSNRK